MVELVDQFLMENAKIIEGDKKKLPEGVLLRVQGLGQKCGVQNANKRTYSKEVWDFVFSNEPWLNKVKNGAMVGEVDHPEKNIPSAQRASHVIREVTWDGAEPIDITFDVLDTPSGRILETLYKAGVSVGVSSRGDGAVKDDGSGGELVEVGYLPDTWDCVINPSTDGAFPVPVNEAANQTALIEAMRGLVNKSPGRRVLLECYSVLNNLTSLNPSVNEDRNKLVSKLTETLTNEEDKTMGQDMNMLVPAIPSPTQDATTLEAMFSARLEQAIQPLEAKIADLRTRLLEKDEELSTIKKQLDEKVTALTDLQRQYEDIEKQQQEVDVSMGGRSVAELSAQLENARSKVIPEMLEENSRLAEELKAAQSLVEAHTQEADDTRVGSYIESVISRYPDDQKSKVRVILSECKDVIAADECLTQLEALIGKPQSSKGRPVSRTLKATRTEQRRIKTTESKPMTQREAAERRELPTPRSISEPQKVVSGGAAPTIKNGAQRMVSGLTESLGG